MNKEFLKYSTKMMFFLVLAFIGLMFCITLFVGIVTKDINYAFWSANYEFGNYLLLMIMLLTGICFRESVTKEYKDVIYSLPINKKQYFDVLFVKTLITTAIPFTYFIVIELISYVINVPVANFQSGIYIFIAYLIPTFFLITVMIFVISISACVVPMLTTLFFVFLTYTYSSFGLNLNYLAPKYLGIMFVLNVVLIFISRKLFEFRRAERIGKLFMFRGVEISFTCFISMFLGFVVTAVFGILFTIEMFNPSNVTAQIPYTRYTIGAFGNVLALIVMAVSYIFIDSLFVKSLSKQNIRKNLKYVVLTIVIYFVGLVVFALLYWR